MSSSAEELPRRHHENCPTTDTVTARGLRQGEATPSHATVTARTSRRDDAPTSVPSMVNLLLTASALAFVLPASGSAQSSYSDSHGLSGLQMVLRPSPSRQLGSAEYIMTTPRQQFGENVPKFIQTDGEITGPEQHNYQVVDGSARPEDDQQKSQIYADTRPSRIAAARRRMEKRRLVVRVPFAQNPDTMQLSRIYKSLFTHQKEKKQLFHYRMLRFVERK